MKLIPVKFGIRYYLLVGWDVPYVQYMWDKNSGNRSGIPPPVGSFTLFRELRCTYDGRVDGSIENIDSPSEMWCLHMWNQTKVHPMDCGPCFVTDKFFTRHTLAKQLLELGDEDAIIRDTVGSNVVEAVNLPVLK